MLRHTYVTTMLDAGADLRDVQIAARHADPRTTMRYDRARNNLDRHPNYILAAYMASIEVYIRVALGGGADNVAYAPGKIGTAYARQTLKLAAKRVVQISNFIGFALERTSSLLLLVK